MPKMVKKMENDSNDSTLSRNKLNKNRNAENTTKISEECQKKVKKECAELGADSNSKTNFVITGSVSNGGDDVNHGEPTLRTYQRNMRNMDLISHFFGESRDLAYVIEGFVI